MCISSGWAAKQHLTSIQATRDALEIGHDICSVEDWSTCESRQDSISIKLLFKLIQVDVSGCIQDICIVKIIAKELCHLNSLCIRASNIDYWELWKESFTINLHSRDNVGFSSWGSWSNELGWKWWICTSISDYVIWELSCNWHFAICWQSRLANLADSA